MKNAAVLLSLMLATILLAFSVSVFAVDSSGPAVVTPCPSGYTQTAHGCGQTDVVEMKGAYTRGAVHPLCDQDSDCPNGQVCQSCDSVRDVFNEEQCPSGKSFCSSAKQ